MRLFLLLSLILRCSIQLAQGQSRPITRVYLYNPFVNLQLAATPDNALKVVSGTKIGYVLIETDFDSLSLKDPSGQAVYLVFEPGKTYYYSYDPHSASYKELSANPFWLSVATWSKYHYRYSITKQSGLVKVE